MLDKMFDGTWAIYCDKCGEYVSALPSAESEAEDDVICQECFNKGEDEDDFSERNDWLQKVANSLEEEYGPCPYGRKELISWINAEVVRLKARGVPGGEAATMELALSYWGWLGDEPAEPF